MELVKNIFFNTDKLIENSTIKVSYSGKFFEDNSDMVYIHYGFGPDWENTAEKEMEKTELGFQAEINLQSSECLNFCFRNSNDCWDNNEGQDYSFPIEKAELALVVADEKAMSHGLRKSYLWSKKIRLAVYKIIRYFPKIISGNYKRKVNNDENV